MAVHSEGYDRTEHRGVSRDFRRQKTEEKKRHHDGSRKAVKRRYFYENLGDWFRR